MGRLAAGSLNQRVTIQYKTLSRDAWGQPQDVWLTLCEVYGNVHVMNGAAYNSREFIAGGQEVGRSLASIRIRRREDITRDMRVLYRGQYYDIKDVLADEENMELMDLAVAYGTSNG